MAHTDRKDRTADMAAGASPTLARHADAAARLHGGAEPSRPARTLRYRPTRGAADSPRARRHRRRRSSASSAGRCSGHAVAVPVAVVAAVSVQAGITDARTLLIPNQLVLAGLTAVAVGAPFVALVDHRPFGDVAAAIVAGWILGGAPMLFALWLVRPDGVGGGDWKILTAQSAAVGLVAPYAAPLILLGGGIGGARPTRHPPPATRPAARPRPRRRLPRRDRRRRRVPRAPRRSLGAYGHRSTMSCQAAARSMARSSNSLRMLIRSCS